MSLRCHRLNLFQYFLALVFDLSNANLTMLSVSVFMRVAKGKPLLHKALYYQMEDFTINVLVLLRTGCMF